MIDSLSCGTAVIGTDVAFEGITDFPGLFKEAIEMCKANSLNLPAAIFAEGAHLKSDEFTKLGLPVPVLETINPDFASKLYKSNYDALCFLSKIDFLINPISGLMEVFYHNLDSISSKTKSYFQ